MLRKRLWLLPILLAVLAGGSWYFNVRSAKEAPELPVYVMGGERMAAGEEIYRRGIDARPFTYPPFSAVPFVPFARLPASWQPPAWFSINFLILLSILIWLHRWASAPRSGAGRPRLFWLWLLVGLLTARHLLAVFKDQSHDLLLFAAAALGIMAWVRGGWIGRLMAGGAFGMAGAIKATPLLFLEMTALRRAWLGTLALVVVAAGLSLLPDVLFPRHDGVSWVYAWFDINLRSVLVGGTATAEGAWGPHSILNQGLSGTLTRLFSPMQSTGGFVRDDLLLLDLPPWLLEAIVMSARLLVLVAIGWGVLRAGRAARQGEETRRQVALGECGLVLCGMVLLSPQSSKAHFCVLLVPAVFCVDQMLRGRRDLLLWSLVIASAVLATGAAKDLLGVELGNRVLGFGAVTWTTVVLLLATLRALRGAASEVREIRVEPPPLMDEPDDPALYSQADLVGQEQPT